jgi:hypothetical protein
VDDPGHLHEHPQAMTQPTRVGDLFDLPDQVRKGDFVVKLDRFDAVMGVLGMIAVILGLRPVRIPDSDSVRGWRLDSRARRAVRLPLTPRASASRRPLSGGGLTPRSPRADCRIAVATMAWNHSWPCSLLRLDAPVVCAPLRPPQPRRCSFPKTMPFLPLAQHRLSELPPMGVDEPRADLERPQILLRNGPKPVP